MTDFLSLARQSVENMGVLESLRARTLFVYWVQVSNLPYMAGPRTKIIISSNVRSKMVYQTSMWNGLDSPLS